MILRDVAIPPQFLKLHRRWEHILDELIQVTNCAYLL